MLILFQLDTVGQNVTEFIYDVVPQLDPWQPGNFTLTPCAFNRDVIMAQDGWNFPFFLRIWNENRKKLNRIRRQSLLMYKNGSKPISSFLNYFGKPMDDFCNSNSLATKYLNKSFILKLLRGREKITKIISLLNKCKT